MRAALRGSLEVTLTCSRLVYCEGTTSMLLTQRLDDLDHLVAQAFATIGFTRADAKQHEELRLGGAEQAGRMRVHLEVRVLGELELVDHPLQHVRRNDDGGFAGNGVGGRPEGSHDRIVEDLLLAAVDHESGCRRVLRPDQHQQRQRKNHAEHGAEHQHPYMTPQHEIHAAEVDARLRKCLFHCYPSTFKSGPPCRRQARAPWKASPSWLTPLRIEPVRYDPCVLHLRAMGVGGQRMP